MPRCIQERLCHSDSSNRLGGVVNSRRTREWHYVKVGRSVHREMHCYTKDKHYELNSILLGNYYSVYSTAHKVTRRFSNTVNRQKIGETINKKFKRFRWLLIHKTIIFSLQSVSSYKCYHIHLSHFTKNKLLFILIIVYIDNIIAYINIYIYIDQL